MSPTGLGPRPAPDAAQPQRTELSWRRTMISFVLALLLLLRLTATAPVAARVGAAGLAFAIWLLLLLVTRRRIAALRAGRLAGPTRATAAIALAVVAYAMLGVLLILPS